MEHLPEVWRNFFMTAHEADNWWERKKALYRRRGVRILQIDGTGVMEEVANPFRYSLHVTFHLQAGGNQYKEEQSIPYMYANKEDGLHDHQAVVPTPPDHAIAVMAQDKQSNPGGGFDYDRKKAVSYAHKWWNDYNPDFETFAVDCTNYVSQCLLAGGAPMHGMPDREKGWWYQDGKWSFSWSVSHSLKWYLSTATTGLVGTEVNEPGRLRPGDVILYDFEGDGRWDHSTIVVSSDHDGMPLVNAHTDNSRNRYWSYEDSMAWTPNIAYAFFQIGK